MRISNDFSGYSEAQLWQAFRSGDEAAFQYIYDRYAYQLHTYGRHVTKNRELVEDCIHDLFVYLHEHRNTLGETDSIKYYLFRSLRRRMYETIRKQGKAELDTPAEIDKHAGFLTPSPETELIENQSLELRSLHLGEAINQLPRRQREALYLLYYDGLTYKEAASVMSLEVRTVYNQVHSAMETLKTKLRTSHLPTILLITGSSLLFLLS